MKAEARVVFVALSGVMDATLCLFCKYGSWNAEGCCEGYSECQHPIEALSWENVHEETLEPGGDCYGFRPHLSVTLAADLVGAILVSGFDEWSFKQFSKTSATVYGRSYKGGVISDGKIRIG